MGSDKSLKMALRLEWQRLLAWKIIMKTRRFRRFAEFFGVQPDNGLGMLEISLILIITRAASRR